MSHQKIPFFTGVLFMIGFSIFYFQHLFVMPNGFLGINGDGYKNYATVSYHVKNDATYQHFEGMNYPHGDYILFADAQPFFANIIKFFAQYIPSLAENTRFCLHLLLLGSFLFSFYLLYRVFILLQVDKNYSIWLAFVMVWLSPQLARWQEHYALGYTFLLPLTMYFLLRFRAEKKWHWSLAIGILLFVASQIHFYYFGILLLLLSSFLFFDVVFHRSKKHFLAQIPHFLLQVVVPFLAVIFILSQHNHISDRPSVPGGFLTYRALWQGLFVHHESLWHHLFQWQKPPLFTPMENVVYLGFGSFLSAFYLFFMFFKAKKYEKWRNITFDTPTLLVVTTLPFLLLALGLPFVISDWEKLLPLTGPLQQFRGVGRFAWLFFYAFNIFIFWKLAQKIPHKNLWFFIAIGVVDALYLNRQPINVLPADFFSKNLEKNTKNIDFTKYQAILPLPFFSIGSEQFDISPDGETLPLTMFFAEKYRLPLAAAQMSRTSFVQSYQIQRFATTYDEKKPLYLQNVLPDKPFLVIQNKASFGQRDTTFDFWNGFKCRYLNENDKLKFYEFYPNDFTPNIVLEKKNVYLEKKMYLNADNIVYKKNLEGQQTGKVYTLSFDWLCEEQPQPLLEYHIRELDPATGAQRYITHYGCRYHRTAMYDDFFVHCEIPFTTKYDDTIVEVTLFYHQAPKQTLLIVKNLDIR